MPGTRWSGSWSSPRSGWLRTPGPGSTPSGTHLKHLRISRVLGSPEQRRQALRRDADIYVIGRDNVVWLVDHYRGAWPFDMVVIDELSSFKNPQSKRFRRFAG